MRGTGYGERTSLDAALDVRTAGARQSPWRVGPDQVAWRARLETELGNLRAALDWSTSPAGDAELGLRTAAALWWYWPQSGHLREGRAHLSRLLALYTEPTSVRAWGLQTAAQAAYLAGDLLAARAQARAALGIAKAPLDARTILWAHMGLGTLAMLGGDPTGAEAILRRGLSYAEQAADPAALDVLLWNLGEVKRGQGDLTAAQRLLEEALARSRAHGHHAGVCYALASLGHLALVRGEFGGAVALQVECLVVRQAVDALNIPYCLDELAMIATATADLARATRLFGAAAALREHSGGAPWPLTFAEREQSLAAARAGLGHTAFEAAWQVGRTLSLPQAISEAAELVSLADAWSRARRGARPSAATHRAAPQAWRTR
jgi:tetratricopeptide (TPR) repeat protein